MEPNAAIEVATIVMNTLQTVALAYLAAAYQRP